MSRETDSSSSGPKRRGGSSYPSGTEPYGTSGSGADQEGRGTDPAAGSKPDEPKTETTLTTRIRINIPGSRPIPPVVMRTPVGDENEGGKPGGADKGSTKGGASAPDLGAGKRATGGGPPPPPPGPAGPPPPGTAAPGGAAAAPGGSGASGGATGPAGAEGRPSAGANSGSAQGDGAAEPEGSFTQQTSDWFSPRKPPRSAPPASASGGGPGGPTPETTGTHRLPGPADTPPEGVPQVGSGAPAGPTTGPVTGDMTGPGPSGTGPGPLAAPDTDPGQAYGAGQTPGPGQTSGPGRDFGADGFFGAGSGPAAGRPPGANGPFGPGQGGAPERGASGLDAFGLGERPDGATSKPDPFGERAPGTTAGHGHDDTGTHRAPGQGADSGPGAPGSGPSGTPPAGIPAVPGAGAPPAPGAPSSPGSPGAPAGESPVSSTLGLGTGPGTFAPGGADDAGTGGPGPAAGPDGERRSSDTMVSGVPQVGTDGGTGGPAAPGQGASSPSPAPTGGAAAPQAAKAAKPARKGGRSKLVLAGVAVVGVLGVAYGTGLLLDHADVPKGTTVLGVEIGGLSKHEAVNKLDSALGERTKKPFTIKTSGGSQKLKPSVAGVTLDNEATVRAAAGRDYNPVSVIGSLFGQSREAEAAVKVDDAKVRSALGPLVEKAEAASPSEGMVKFTGGKAVAVKGSPHKVVDIAKAPDALEQAFEQRAVTGKNEPVELPGSVHEPKVTQADLDKAVKGFGRTAMSGWVWLEAGDVKVPFSQKTLGTFLTMRPGGSGTLQPVIDTEKLAATYGSAFDDVVIKAGAGTVKMTPKHAAAAMVKALNEKAPPQPGQRVAKVPGSVSQ
ncbi:hypothetical protein [Streptomyces reniochalinae]|uniref:Peptidoglycan binding domain-containing protein n=1 Tax=Streptomyces reniochalinae TaxID=2250578 RepID=A0A367EX94_9ACTN|nr:hypothetical protein [Streptomyces reniochalinae]RCG22631.1 hypothetical protein DQ392_06240 [Streptomyces reniochalinae]